MIIAQNSKHAIELRRLNIDFVSAAYDIATFVHNGIHY